jgi:tyrosinase
MRWPTTMDSSAQPQISQLIQRCNSDQNTLKQRLYNILTSQSDFMKFGNEAWNQGQSGGSYDSLENIHDVIHVDVGGNNYGDMMIIAVSAFDPAFWLHHAMIDRAFALWQALYPDSYVEPQPQVQNSFWYNTGETLDGNTPLKPFFSDPRGDFWTSNTARDLTTFGYTYNELQSNDTNAIKAAINALYGPATAVQKRSVSSNATGAEVDRLYQLNIRSPQNALNGTYFIDFFHNSPSSPDPSTWSTDPNRIGSYTSMSMYQVPGDTPSSSQVMTSGVVPLNTYLEGLVASGQIADMCEATVMGYLTDSIVWRARNQLGEEAAVGDLTELKVSVVSIGVIPPADAMEFPQYVGGWKVHTGVTSGKPGGLCFNDTDY